MRRLILLTLFLCATAAMAQSPGAVHLSGFSLESSNDYHAPNQRDYGGELEYFLSKNVSAAVAVSSEATVVTSTFNDPALGPIPARAFGRVQPIDMLLRYRFASDSRLQPWLGAGPRLIRVEGNNNWRGVLDGGLTISLTRNFGIDLEAKRLYHQTPLDQVARIGNFGEGSSRRLSAGLSWTF